MHVWLKKAGVRSRAYENLLLNLLKSFIPDISTSTLTIFSVEALESCVKLCNSVYSKLDMGFPSF